MIPEGERLEILEKIGAYTAGELEGDEARRAEQLILENEDNQRLSEAYTRMLILLSVMGQESPVTPDTVVDYAVQRAYYSALMRQTETFFSDLGRSYLDAFVYYLGLRPKQESYGGGF
ncbi:MAG: hypothetical protein ACR2GU_12990 [Rubrobacteraceae bacterium]